MTFEDVWEVLDFYWSIQTSRDLWGPLLEDKDEDVYLGSWLEYNKLDSNTISSYSARYLRESAEPTYNIVPVAEVNKENLYYNDTLNQYKPSIALPNKVAKKKINKDPEVEIEAEIVSLIVKKMDLGLRPYVHVMKIVSSVEKFIETDIIPFDPEIQSGNGSEVQSIIWLPPRIYDKIKAKYLEVQAVLENLNRVQQEAKATLNSLEDSIANLKDKGHDFIF